MPSARVIPPAPHEAPAGSPRVGKGAATGEHAWPWRWKKHRRQDPGTCCPAPGGKQRALVKSQQNRAVEGDWELTDCPVGKRVQPSSAQRCV